MFNIRAVKCTFVESEIFYFSGPTLRPRCAGVDPLCGGFAQNFLLSALLMACDWLVLWFFAEANLELPSREPTLFEILLWELLAPRFCFPFELLVWSRVACFDP